MTRAQIADPDLVAALARGERDRIRPCVLCNQACQVRDARNPIVSCVVEPSSGHESRDPEWCSPAAVSRRVLIVGAGPAGLEAARIAATRGHRVRLVERSTAVGGIAALAGPAAEFVRWQRRELERLGVSIEFGVSIERGVPVDSAPHGFDVCIQATGSRRGRPDIDLGAGAELIDVVDVHRGTVELPSQGSIVILDPIGGPIGVSLAEALGERAVLVTPDNIAGNELARTGDLAPANVRLAQRGVRILKRSVPRAVTALGGELLRVSVQDRFSGEFTDVDCTAVVDAGFRLPTEPLDISMDVVAVGDCVAPRTILEAVLEGRRAAAQI